VGTSYASCTCIAVRSALRKLLNILYSSFIDFPQCILSPVDRLSCSAPFRRHLRCVIVCSASSVRVFVLRRHDRSTVASAVQTYPSFDFSRPAVVGVATTAGAAASAFAPPTVLHRRSSTCSSGWQRQRLPARPQTVKHGSGADDNQRNIDVHEA